MGETPNNAINRQQTMGIQTLRHEILAVFAILKHGAAMSATTAGRTPLKNFSTHGLSLKLWKNMDDDDGYDGREGYADGSDDASPYSFQLISDM